MTIRPPGRPRSTSLEAPLQSVTFKADRETVDAIAKLTEAASGAGIRRPKSAAIRKALIEAAERLKPVKK